MEVLDKEIVMQSWVWTQGREQGEKLGELRGEQRTEERSIVRLFEKRLARPLTEDQRATLVRRLGALGYDRLVDLRDDLSADALAAWLDQADPS